MRNYLYAVFCIMVISACEKREISGCDDSTGLYVQSDFPVGVAIDMEELLYNQKYEEIVIGQFNSITPENIFKADHLHPAPGVFNWIQADILADFCTQNNKRLHGHTLIWHDQLPGWIKNYNGSAQEWEVLFKDHIQTIVRHFKGKAAAWDVVNEAFNDDGTLRSSLWKEKIGASYIEKAFRYAHEADPEALLFYNDYDIALNEKKRAGILKLLQNLRQRGVPVHGIGMQMHISVLHPENKQIADAFQEIYQNGYQIHLSEIDISLNPTGKETVFPEELLLRQARKLAAVTALYKSIPPRYRYGMTIWGVSDANTWITSRFNRADLPLLYDRDFEPKPVYCAFKNAL